MATHDQYFEVLGIEPNATLEEVNAAYFALLENFPEQPTPVEIQYQQKLQHAYAIVRRLCEEQQTQRLPRPTMARPRAASPAKVLALLGVGLVILVVMNWGALRLKLTRYEPGDLLRFHNASAPYGEVLSYDPAHRFGIGKPVGAYEIRLRETGESVWLNERVVVKGMVEVQPPTEPAR